RRGIVRAVDGVSFDVPRGGALGLVGESGSGKSMTLRAILGVLPAEAQVTSGEIRLDGVDLVQLRGSDINRLRGPKMAMIFQEPTLRRLTRLCRESGVSLVFVTHDLPVVAQVCRDVAVMYGGQLVEQGEVREVLLDPRHPYTLGLVRSAPDFEYVRESLVP